MIVVYVMIVMSLVFTLIHFNPILSVVGRLNLFSLGLTDYSANKGGDT